MDGNINLNLNFNNMKNIAMTPDLVHNDDALINQDKSPGLNRAANMSASGLYNSPGRDKEQLEVIKTLGEKNGSVDEIGQGLKINKVSGPVMIRDLDVGSVDNPSVELSKKSKISKVSKATSKKRYVLKPNEEVISIFIDPKTGKKKKKIKRTVKDNVLLTNE